MPIAITAVLFVVWIALAYRAFQRGDMLMAGVYLLVGIALSAYRISRFKKSAPPQQP